MKKSTTRQQPCHFYLRVCRICSGIGLLAMLSLTGGCGKTDDGMTGEQQAKTDRLGSIVQQSGGDWNKVSPPDRDYLRREIGSGSEQTARMLLMAKAGRFKAKPGEHHNP